MCSSAAEDRNCVFRRYPKTVLPQQSGDQIFSGDIPKPCCLSRVEIKYFQEISLNPAASAGENDLHISGDFIKKNCVSNRRR